MAVTKNDNYENNKTLLKLGSRVKAPNGRIGTVCRITDYKDPKYDYKTASVRFDDKSIRSRVYSIGSLQVLDAHKRALFEELTDEPCIVNLDDFAIDFVVKFMNNVLYGYTCGKIIRKYFLSEDSIDDISRELRISKGIIEDIIKTIVYVAKHDEAYLNSICLLSFNSKAPLGLILSEPTTYFLKTKCVYTIRDLISVSRPDLYRCDKHTKAEIGNIRDYLHTRKVV